LKLTGKRGKMDASNLANLALDFASIINFIALILMLRAVIKNRKVLRGYSIVGSFLTFVSIVGFEVAYYLLGNVIGFALGWATVAFWFITFLYTLRQKLKGPDKEKKMVEP
jgi:uncharacterized membrane protein